MGRPSRSACQSVRLCQKIQVGLLSSSLIPRSSLQCSITFLCAITLTDSVIYFGQLLEVPLKDDGFFEELQALAIKEVVVWHLTEAMEKQSLFKASLATLLKTGRSQVDRLLDPTRVVTLSILQRAAALVGRKVQIEDEVWN